MKGLGCLVKDTSIRKDIAEIIELAAADAIQSGKTFSVANAYKLLRDNKVEIDKESVAVIYEDTFDLNDGNFSSADTVDEFALRDFRETLDNLAKMEASNDVKQIGTQSSGKAAATQIAKMFKNAFVTDKKTQSVMRKLQDIMFKAAQRKVDKSMLPEKEKKAKKTFDEVLQDAFHWQDEVGFERITGGLNGAREVFTEFKKELKKYIDELKGTDASEQTIEDFERYGQALIDKSYDLLLSEAEANQIVKEALVEAGFGKTVNRNGEKVQVLDWSKLSEGTGIPNYIEDNVTESLKKKGFSEEQIRRINASLINEYNSLTAEIIKKAAEEIELQNQRQKESNLSELERRNKIQQYNQSIDAERLARLYNLGLFEFTPNAYEVLLNKMVGMSDVDMKTWNQLKVFGRALSTLYSAKLVNAAGEQTDIDKFMLRVATNSISERIGSVLRQNQNSNNRLLKIARVIDGWVSAGMRMILASLGNMILDNPISGFFASKTADLRLLTKGVLGGKEFREQRKKYSDAVFRDISYGRGEHYGDVSSTFYARNGLDHLKNKADDFVTGGKGSGSRFMQGVLSFFTGKMMLDAVDSKWKANLTNKYMVHHLVKILTDKNNPNGFKTKQEALNFVSENLLGSGYAKAEQQARDIIKRVNDAAGTDILSTDKDYVTRLANDIVLGNLTGYQPNLDREVITPEQVVAAYNSSYKLAGRDLGHVANNMLSKAINNFSGTITRNIDKAVKEKNYPMASAYTFVGMLNKAVLNPFVGGGTNWAFLTAERAFGLGFVTGGVNYVLEKSADKSKAKAKGTVGLDFGNDASMKEFEERLYETSLRQSQVARSIIGGFSGMVVAAIVQKALEAEFGDDDDEARRRYASWKEQNRAISKITDKFVPELLTAITAHETGDMQRYAETKFSLGQDRYSPQAMLSKAIYYASKGETDKASGAVGEMVGRLLNMPVPWRIVRDVVDLKDNFEGDYKKPNYVQSKSFMEGVMKNGFLKWINPDEAVSDGRVKKQRTKTTTRKKKEPK